MGKVLTPQNRAATEAVPGIPFPKYRENRQYWDYESYCQGPKGLAVEPPQKTKHKLKHYCVLYIRVVPLFHPPVLYQLSHLYVTTSQPA